MSEVQVPQHQKREIHIARGLALGLAGAVAIYPLIAIANPTIVSDQKLLVLDLNIKLLIGFAALFPLWIAARIESTIRAAATRKFKANGNREALRATFLLEILVGFTVRELSAVVGFGLSYLTSEPIWTVILSAVTLASMIYHWPKEAPQN